MATSLSSGTSRRTLLVLAGLFGLAHGALAQPSGYREILEAYRRGEAEAAVSALAQMPVDQRYRSARSVVGVGIQPFRRDVVQSVLALQTEVAFRERAAWIGCDISTRAFQEDSPVATRHLLADGRRFFEYALLDALKAHRPEDDDFLRAWYLTVMAYSRRWAPGAVRCFQHAPARIQRDAEMQLAFGAMHEGQWWSMQSEGWSPSVLRPSLQVAERAFRAAIAETPGPDEARLRLGRVLALQSKPEEALEVFREVQPRLQGEFGYLVRLFEGEAYEQLGDLVAAADSYAEAHAMMPHAESGIVACASLAHATGRRADAAREIVGISKATATGGSGDPWAWRATGGDPWAWYNYGGTAWRFPEYLARLRALVQRGR